MTYLARIALFSMLFVLHTFAASAQTVPETCSAGEMLSLDWPEQEHIVAPGCYTQEAADSWCEQNYKANTSAGADGDYLFCNCAEGFSYDSATMECVGGDEAVPVIEEDMPVAGEETAPVPEGTPPVIAPMEDSSSVPEDTCVCPNA